MTEAAHTTKPRLWRDRRKIADGYDRIIFHEFNILEDHRRFVEEHFSTSVARIEKQFTTELSGWQDPDQRAAYEDHLIDEYQLVAKDLWNLQRRAQFLVIYSKFEHALNRLCRIVQRRSKLATGLEHITKDKGISKAAKYLKNQGVVEPFDTKHWNNALTLGKIRNHIAHGDGVMNTETAESLAGPIKSRSLVSNSNLMSLAKRNCCFPKASSRKHLSR